MVDVVGGDVRGMLRADVDDEAEFGEDADALTSKPMPSKAIVGGLPSIHACTFHSAA